MIYPITAALAFLISPYKVWAKVLGIVSGPVLLIPFIIASRNAAKEMTGTAQFPILSGWQWGNNALYMRNYIEVDTMAFPTKETAELDHIARDFFRNTEPQKRDLANYVANFFIRKGNAPLKQYLYKHYRMNNDAEQVVAWGMVSPVFGQYGLFLIKRHPIAFARYFMLMNCKNYFLPPLEKLEIYNLGQDKMWPIGQFWFSYSSDRVWCVSKYLQALILIIFPILYLLLNLFYGSTFAILMQQQGFHKGGDHFANLIILISAFLLLNFIFSIFANIIVIRYQIFPMTLFAIFGMVILKYILLNLKTRQLERGKDMTPAKNNVMMPQ
jgi:hypothetical protein